VPRSFFPRVPRVRTLVGKGRILNPPPPLIAQNAGYVSGLQYCACWRVLCILRTKMNPSVCPHPSIDPRVPFVVPFFWVAAGCPYPAYRVKI